MGGVNPQERGGGGGRGNLPSGQELGGERGKPARQEWRGIGRGKPPRQELAEVSLHDRSWEG